MDLNPPSVAWATCPSSKFDHADDAGCRSPRRCWPGGVGCIESDAAHPAGLPSIAEIVNSGVPMMAGVGTVTHADQVRACVDAGAQFAVSPGYAQSDWPRACHDANCRCCRVRSHRRKCLHGLTMDGTRSSFSGIALRRRRVAEGNLRADPAGQFLPTGGIRDDDIPAYLACPNLAAFGSSAVASRSLIAGAKVGTKSLSGRRS